jgi:putative phosphoesterase
VRIAIVSDIHANLTALEAVIADLTRVAPDLVVHGGDLVAGGARAAEVIDVIRDAKWPGVYGNADEMLWMPERIDEMLGAPELRRMRELLLTRTIPALRETIGDERVAWLRALPIRWSTGDLTVVHAAPDNVWRSPGAAASDEELEQTYGGLSARCVAFGHIHTPFVRRLRSRTVANTGSVSLSFDGDPRAAYLVVDGDRVEIRRVAYDVETEVALLAESQDPFAPSTIASLRKAAYVPLPA